MDVDEPVNLKRKKSSNEINLTEEEPEPSQKRAKTTPCNDTQMEIEEEDPGEEISLEDSMTRPSLPGVRRPLSEQVFSRTGKLESLREYLWDWFENLCEAHLEYALQSLEFSNASRFLTHIISGLTQGTSGGPSPDHFIPLLCQLVVSDKFSLVLNALTPDGSENTLCPEIVAILSSHWKILTQVKNSKGLGCQEEEPNQHLQLLIFLLVEKFLVFPPESGRPNDTKNHPICTARDLLSTISRKSGSFDLIYEDLFLPLCSEKLESSNWTDLEAGCEALEMGLPSDDCFYDNASKLLEVVVTAAQGGVRANLNPPPLTFLYSFARICAVLTHWIFRYLPVEHLVSSIFSLVFTHLPALSEGEKKVRTPKFSLFGLKTSSFGSWAVLPLL